MEKLVDRFVDKKLVIVTNIGPIMPLGGVYGPVGPQVLDTHTIAVLLQNRYKLKEVLKNGEQVELSLGNYNVDLNGDGGEYVKKIKKPNEDVLPVPKRNPNAGNKNVTVADKPEEKKQQNVNQGNQNQNQNNNHQNQKPQINIQSSDKKEDKAEAGSKSGGQSGTNNNVKADKLTTK